ncbi:MAG TPA: class I SAM-dependent methyltransferase [Rhodanobacteraceae bacterium]|nr:class I SAM-dependent methyltransferase [Rhodanobacteraceae bacterium]
MSKSAAPSNQSAPVHSAQTAVHVRLREVVERHLAQPWRAPVQDASRAAFGRFVKWLAGAPAVPWWLDSGCGTGASTLALARRQPRCMVVGIDRSAARLATGQRALAAADAPANALLLRCDAPDFWRLARSAGFAPARHLLLYPNPSPKAAQLRRRWHAHPAFPALLALGGELELRCNWRVYAQEFAEALGIAGRDAAPERFVPGEPLTPFERKYAASGHALWRVRAPSH